MGRPSTTHDLTFTDVTVTKRFCSWERGEHRREWRALRLLAVGAPDLAPTPLYADLDTVPPAVTMSRLPGKPLGASPVDPRQAAALAAALRDLHDAVPPDQLNRIPARLWSSADALVTVRALLADAMYDGDDPDVVRALDAARAWSATTDIESTIPAEDLVFGRADGNLANALWDGERVRLVDFEDSGSSDRCFELADTIEHPSAFVGDRLDVSTFIAGLGLTRRQGQRLTGFRRLFACFWHVLLLPGGQAHRRNPSGTLELHAHRMGALL